MRSVTNRVTKLATASDTRNVEFATKRFTWLADNQKLTCRVSPGPSFRINFTKTHARLDGQDMSDDYCTADSSYRVNFLNFWLGRLSSHDPFWTRLLAKRRTSWLMYEKSKLTLPALHGRRFNSEADAGEGDTWLLKALSWRMDV